MGQKPKGNEKRAFRPPMAPSRSALLLQSIAAKRTEGTQELRRGNRYSKCRSKMKKQKFIELAVKVVVAALTAFLTAITTTSCLGQGPF